MILYIIGSTSKKFLKVGVADDPHSRLKQLQTGNPEKLTIIKTYDYETRENAMKIEKIIHKKLNSKRLIGEWFENVDIKDIQSIIINNRI